ncbi:WD40 repeat domain-containing protein [Methanoplanus endosymbiosus]|uniref:Uncharacterized protein n=1 Tax=Methanoplanus endosymbiosus TaxID=33865 RepID=A0A9E7TIM9_9EURY|nr:PQQ-binding-like beta-propeller repeat protein [Methanoplanus endosymbiosus]UUX92713.1 hypothetical protein L6E24_00880 [Methanoplanus endosymbiosus]
MKKYFFLFFSLLLILTIPSFAAAGNNAVSTDEIYFEKLWEVRTVPGTAEISISGDGETLAGGGTGGFFCCDNKGSILWTKELGLSDNAAVSDDSRKILSGGVSLNLFDHDGSSLFRKNYGYVIRSVAISHEGNLLYFATDNQDLNIYNTTDETEVSFDAGYDLDSVAVSEDGNYIAGGSSIGDLIFMDEEGNNIWTRKSHSGKPVIDLDLSSKGDFIVYTVDDTLNALSRTGNIRWNKLIAGAKGVALSADGSYTAVAHDGHVSVFNRNGDLLTDIPGVNGVKDLSFSDDGEYLAFCTDDTSGLFRMITKESSGVTGSDYSSDNTEGLDISESRDYSEIPPEGGNKDKPLFSDVRNTAGAERTENPEQSGNPVIALTGILLSLLIAGYISGRDW